jgi:hypothetical protein
MPDKLRTAEFYRLRAADLRSVAEGTFDKGERRKLQEMAATYEHMAHEVEAAQPAARLHISKQA